MTSTTILFRFSYFYMFRRYLRFHFFFLEVKVEGSRVFTYVHNGAIIICPVPPFDCVILYLVIPIAVLFVLNSSRSLMKDSVVVTLVSDINILDLGFSAQCSTLSVQRSVKQGSMNTRFLIQELM